MLLRLALSARIIGIPKSYVQFHSSFYMCCYEHQRFWIGLGWKPTNTSIPTGFNKYDPPPFLDIASGLNATDCTTNAKMSAVVDDDTDTDGWEYSFDFDRINNAREGGRAQKRVHDLVRRFSFSLN